MWELILSGLIIILLPTIFLILALCVGLVGAWLFNLIYDWWR